MPESENDKAILRSVMGDAEAELLYHYTSEAGLRGIIENDNIWATDIHFLNDWTEFSHLFNDESLEKFLDVFISSLPTDIAPGARRVTIDGVLAKRNFPRLLAIIESRPPLGKPKESSARYCGCGRWGQSWRPAKPVERVLSWIAGF
jgi:hypothetical protein